MESGIRKTVREAELVAVSHTKLSVNYDKIQSGAAPREENDFQSQTHNVDPQTLKITFLALWPFKGLSAKILHFYPFKLLLKSSIFI